ncbi:PspC domain-containing protein [Agromyces albus]|uniref:PspC domain-containing protein n=1 Tax=Agromyces albus TaxID=205332 RepID=A0A4Q2L3A0_9MICO|nr:PspC domain-containing protein [Agromyces albus]RXZ72618.1 PspC domain-containing protein [Agromyces albus]
METNHTAPEAGPAPDDVNGDSAAAGPPGNGAGGSAPSSGAPGAATPAPGTGFYAWLHRLGLPRRAGWLGGVCAGIGARLGIDPLIVRGIVVVIALFGAPLVLLYAIAWLLLPDAEGEIHLERLLRGTVDPAIVGIAVMGVIGMLPIVQDGWLGWRWWPEWPSIWFGGVDVLTPFRVLWVLAVIAGAIALVAWLIRRAAQTSPVSPASSTSTASSTSPGGGAAPRMASASAAAAPGTAPTATDAATATTAVYAAPPVAAGPAAASVVPSVAAGAAGTTPEPPVPAEGADAAALAEWRAQHEAWRTSHEEWKRTQQDADRAARAQAAAENKAKALALAAQADEARRVRRAERPRASAAYVFTVLGLAVIAGSVGAIWAVGSADLSGHIVAVSLAVATLTLALGMFVAAVSRRRSGFLAFATTVTTVVMLGASVASAVTIIPPSFGIPLVRSGTFVQPIGDAHLTAFAELEAAPGTPEIELTQGVGDVHLTILDGTRVTLDARDAGRVQVVSYSNTGAARSEPALGGEGRIFTLGGDPGASSDATLTVRQQQSGTIYVTIHEEAGR